MAHLVHQLADQVPAQPPDPAILPVGSEIRCRRLHGGEGRSLIQHREGEGPRLHTRPQHQRAGGPLRIGVIDHVDQHLFGGEPHVVLALPIGPRLARGVRRHVKQFGQGIQPRRGMHHADESHAVSSTVRRAAAVSG